MSLAVRALSLPPRDVILCKHFRLELFSSLLTVFSQYIVSSGKDSLVFLWELSTGKILHQFNRYHVSLYSLVAAIIQNHPYPFLLLNLA